MNNVNATLNVTSPHFMKYKREKGLKTLCVHKRAKSSNYTNRKAVGLNILKANLKLFNIKSIDKNSDNRVLLSNKADLVLRMNNIEQNNKGSKEALVTVETVEQEVDSFM